MSAVRWRSPDALCCRHAGLVGAGRGALAAVLRAALTAGGLADGLAALVACGVDHGLAAVKLRLLLGGQVPALVAGQGHKFLLAGKGFLQFIHGFSYLLLKIRFLFAWICRSYTERGAHVWPASARPTPTVGSAGTDTTDTSSGVHFRAIWQGP